MTAYVLTTEHKDIQSTSLRTTIFKIFEFLLYPSIRKKTASEDRASERT